MKIKLEDYKDGEHLDHRKECWRFQDCICNYTLIFVTDKETIEKYCKGCEYTNACKALLGNSNINKNKRR